MAESGYWRLPNAAELGVSGINGPLAMIGVSEDPDPRFARRRETRSVTTVTTVDMVRRIPPLGDDPARALEAASRPLERTQPWA